MAASTQTNGKKSTTRTTAPKTPGRRATGGRAPDAIGLLKADHRAVEKLFAQYGKARGGGRKAAIADQIVMALKVHTQIEEEIFYPVSREFLEDDAIVDEAVVEHASAKDLMAQIEATTPDDDLFDAKVTVLQEMIEHHVGEEEKEYFPQVQKTKMDLDAIGARMKARKDELMAEMEGHGRTLQ
jgi:hemerythrin superfamily protein